MLTTSAVVSEDCGKKPDDVSSCSGASFTNMNDDSNQIYKFYCGEAGNDLLDIHTTLRYLLNITNQISNIKLKQRAINYYFENKEIELYGWCYNAERQALARLNNIIICLISIKKQDDKEKSNVTIEFYGENTKGKEFVYMLYEESEHKFYALYAADEENSMKKITIFTHDDNIKNMLRKYIKDDLKCEVNINLDYDINIDEDEESILIDVKIIVEDILNRIEDTKEVKKVSYRNVSSVSMKRQYKNVDDIAISFDDHTKMPIPIPKKYYNPNKRLKIVKDAMSTYDKNNTETETIKNIMHVFSMANSNDQLINQQLTNNVQMVSNDGQQEGEKQRNDCTNKDNVQTNGTIEE